MGITDNLVQSLGILPLRTLPWLNLGMSLKTHLGSSLMITSMSDLDTWMPVIVTVKQDSICEICHVMI